MEKHAHHIVGVWLALIGLQACNSPKALSQADGRSKQQSSARVASPLQLKPLILKGYQHDVRFVCFSPDGKMVMSGDESGEVILWNSKTGRLLRRLPRVKASFMVGTFSPDSKILVYGDTELRVWDVGKNRLLRVLNGHKGMVDSGGEVWDPKTVSVKKLTIRSRAIVYWLTFSADNRWLATGSDDTTVELWNVATGKLQRVLKGHTGTVNALSFSPDGTMLASGANDTAILLWATRTGKLLRRILVKVPYGETGFVHAVCFSRDGTRVTAIAQNGYILAINVKTGQQNLLGREGFINHAAFSGDSSRFALGCWDQVVMDRLFGVVKVGNSQTGKISIQFQKRDLLMNWLALSFDGKRLATAGTGRAKSVQIWNIP